MNQDWSDRWVIAGHKFAAGGWKLLLPEKKYKKIDITKFQTSSILHGNFFGQR